MRRLTLLAALVLAVVLMAAVPVVASEARATLQASLSGEKEVPGPGDPNGRGEAEVKVYEAKVCYELEVERIKPATAAHIHRGGPSVAGPIVVELKAPTDGSSEDTRCRRLRAPSISDPSITAAWVEANTWINTHVCRCDLLKC
jgi:hypothetical protein